AVGDVAGKGSPAALLMALLLAMLRTLVDEGLEPAELVTRLNVQVMKHGRTTRFITLFLGVFDPPSGHLVYVNAGQNPPLLRRAVRAGAGRRHRARHVRALMLSRRERGARRGRRARHVQRWCDRGRESRRSTLRRTRPPACS